MILEYLVPVWADGCPYPREPAKRYGCPVEVFVLGRRMRVIYQFPGGGQPCAVVHLESGRIMAHVRDDHAGYPQEKAQTALNERLREVTPERFELTVLQAPVLNRSAKLVGRMKRP